jgi:hypothetical protein
MDDQRLTRSYLETLSTDDLAELAGRLGLDFPPELNRIFVIEELLDASADDEEDRGEVDDLLEDAPIAPASGLPESYNVTFIGVLLRDPFWAFVFWEIKASEREEWERSSEFGGYRLRVCPLPASRAGSENGSFTVAIEPNDSAWYLSLPKGGGWYRVDLCVVRDKSETVLASSSVFRVPRSSASLPETGDCAATSFLSLSGLADFRVINGADRQSRLLQRCES